MQKAVRWLLVALFSSIIFIINFFVPLPINYLLIVVEAVILSLASLFIRRAGATSVGIVGGLLSALSQPAFGPFTFLFTFLFGLLVDVFSHVFRVFTDADRANRNRVILAMAFSTAIIGFLSYFVTSFYIRIIDPTPMLSALVLFVATGSGISAGYAAAYLWNKHLRNINITLQPQTKKTTHF